MAKIKTKLKRKVSKVKPSRKKIIKKASENNFSTMSFDDFMSKDFEEGISDSEVLLDSEILDNKNQEEKVQIEQESDEEIEYEDEAEKHKSDLKKLKKSDPEFYQFLQENDKKLLHFNLSDDEEEQAQNGEPKDLHKPNENLEVASDESDFEDEEDDSLKDVRVITLKMLKKWQSDIQTDKSNQTIMALSQAFHAALCRVTSQEEDDETPYFKVEGSAVFNGVIQLCVLELGPAIRRFLGLQQNHKQSPHRCKKFTKIKGILKSYFTDLLNLLVGVTSSNIQAVLLKHLHYMSPFLISFPNITKLLVKRLISLWGTADDAVRVVAFFCILRIANNQMASILDIVLKSMYMTYVKNSKFVSLNGLAAINFMRRSLVEMFAIDTNVSYSHVFLYIRQLAIHLRNAITVNKKENIQAVYNWQFINSLRLWGNLLAVTYNKPQMQQLVYPFVQVCLGTIKLLPTTQYYSLRFHVVQILIELEKNTRIFIPILPFLLEVLTTYDFNKKHQKVSMKPIHFTCLLRLSKSQLQESGFKDAVIETVYAQLLEYLSGRSHNISFPDLSLICIIQIKQFLKTCKNANYSRKMKQILEKIDQNNQFIENQRTKMTFNITDFKQIEGWESQVKNGGTPLSTYYESWSKLNNIRKNKKITNNEELGNYKLPTINRIKKPENKKAEGPVDLFPSDSDDEDELTKKPKRGKRGGKNVNKKIIDESGPVEDNNEQDIVHDIEIDDW